MTTRPEALLSAAKAYAAHGWRVLPLKPGQKTPLIKKWPTQATTDVKQVVAWWHKWPTANIGIATGAGSNLVVLDLDRKGEVDGVEVAKAFWDWERPEVCQQTGGGGLQAFYAWRSDAPLANKAALCGHKGVDLRGEGGYVVVPPSLHPNGQEYRWLGNPNEKLDPPLPWFYESARTSSPATNDDGPIPTGSRNATLASLAGTMRRRGMSETAIEAALLAENAKRCSPPLTEAEVRQIAHSIARYTPSPTAQDGDLPEVEIKPEANPPFELFMALMENNKKFKMTWLRERTDFTQQHQYDASLATLAAATGWTAQQIVDLIIAHRRKHNQDAPTQDRLRRTIARAFQFKAKERELLELEDAHQDPIESEDERADVLRKLSRCLGVDIQRWCQHGVANARYSLTLADGNVIQMGTAETVLSARAFRARIYEATKKLLPAMKQPAWDGVCRLLAAVAEVIENQEMNPEFVLQGHIESYLEAHPPVDEANWTEAFRMREPFYKDGYLHITTAELRRYMRIHLSERNTSNADICELLRLAGYERKGVSTRLDGKVISRSFWRIQEQ